MIDWPPSLIDELASRRAIIFIGSGISAGAQNDEGQRPPDWRGLLEKARDMFIHTQDERDFVDEQIKKGALLEAAEVILHDIPQPERRRFFVDVFATPRFKPYKVHELVQKINPKIVVTTNYDQLYEEQCGATMAGRGYSVRKYTDRGILDDIRSKDNLIIKAHGCISDTKHLILTRSDYFEIKQNHGEFYKVLDSLLTISTVLFIGCSMADPDIQLILENTNISAPSQHPHYAVMVKGTHPALIKAMQSSYNIKILEYDYDENAGHSFLQTSLESLKDSVEAALPFMQS
ncbi:SIR2 family protein [Shewanella algae]|uniref:SIR2 family protein n=1 Tax=Shewanella algae TaxID=38313 RepID=UPI0031F572B0